MKAVRIHEYGGAEVLRIDEVEKPQPKADEVLIKTAVAGINYADTMLRAGTYLIRPPFPFVMGFEAAGTIEAVGENVTNFQVGQRVMATMQGGGYAEYAVAKENQLVPIPDGLGFAEATALLAQGLTALGLLRDLKEGQTILIHAAAGGVGTLLVQLAKHKGAKVIGTASTAKKLETVKELGADVCINYTEADWVAQVLAATDGKGVDCLIEMTGGEIGSQNINCMAHQGTMHIYGAASGQDFQLSALGVLKKSLTVKGYILYDETREGIARFTKELMMHIAEGRLKIMVNEFPLDQAVEAHKALEGRKTMGKVVLTVN
jgi:NADPH2:quinone reductase